MGARLCPRSDLPRRCGPHTDVTEDVSRRATFAGASSGSVQGIMSGGIDGPRARQYCGLDAAWPISTTRTSSSSASPMADRVRYDDARDARLRVLTAETVISISPKPAPCSYSCDARCEREAAASTTRPPSFSWPVSAIRSLGPTIVMTATGRPSASKIGAPMLAEIGLVSRSLTE